MHNIIPDKPPEAEKRHRKTRLSMKAAGLNAKEMRWIDGKTVKI
jgi:hypothetical protein